MIYQTKKIIFVLIACWNRFFRVPTIYICPTKNLNTYIQIYPTYEVAALLAILGLLKFAYLAHYIIIYQRKSLYSFFIFPCFLFGSELLAPLFRIFPSYILKCLCIVVLLNISKMSLIIVLKFIC